MQNKIEDLRVHLFKTIESLVSADNPMDIDRAKAVAEVAQVIINSAKVEVDYIRATETKQGTGFMVPELEDPNPPPVAALSNPLPPPRMIKGSAMSGSK